MSTAKKVPTKVGIPTLNLFMASG